MLPNVQATPELRKSYQHVVHVVPRNRRWEVAVDGRTRPMIDWLCTRERAVTHAIELAETILAHDRGTVHVVVAYSDGAIQEELDVTPGAVGQEQAVRHS